MRTLGKANWQHNRARARQERQLDSKNHIESPRAKDAKAFVTNLTRHLDCKLYPLKLRDIIMQWITNAIRK
ncbi:13547_t:CDS:2, partial [Entrophospora sp. SA101]